MKPVTVSIDVPQEIQLVFDHLDVLANHEAFTDHFLVDWTVTGPARGVGGRARLRAKAGRANWMEMQVIESQSPRTTVEETTSAGGRRLTRGTYVLAPLPSGGTRITFELAWLRVPRSERLAAPLVRSVVRRGNIRAMERLRQQLAQQPVRASA